MKLVLCDTNPDMIKAWRVAFKDLENVVILDHTANIFETGTVGIVSPANSHGYMRGGFDFALANHFGKYTEMIVQNHIIAYHDKHLSIGKTATIKMETGNFDNLVVAPTMENSGSDIGGTGNVFFASMAIFRVLKDELDSITCTGLGTGVGGVSSVDCARDMVLAYKTVFGLN